MQARANGARAQKAVCHDTSFVDKGGSYKQPARVRSLFVTYIPSSCPSAVVEPTCMITSVLTETLSA